MITIDTNILVYAEIVGVDPRFHPCSSFKAHRKTGVRPKVPPRGLPSLMLSFDTGPI